jgi:hypothetical protein
MYILSVYRSAKGNFKQFMKGIDNILNYLSMLNTEIIICGDVNINYLAENCNKRQQLDNLLATYNIVSTTEFPTRIANGCTSIIDNIYIDKIHTGRYIACPVINGLPDHDTQLIKLENVFMQKKANEVKIVRNFNTYSISDFKVKLSEETWDNILDESEVNNMFDEVSQHIFKYFFLFF